MYQFNIKDNKLYIGGISAEELIKKYGSPLFVYEENVIINNYNRFINQINYEKLKINYAMKANSNIAILKLLKELGSNIDAVSVEEIEICKRIGFDSDRILFTGINLTDEEMKYAVDNNILINLGSLCSLDRFGKLFPNKKISIRINPDIRAGHHDHCITGGVASKFGIFHSKTGHSDLNEAKSLIKKYGLKLVGIHSHIGSGILDEQKYIELVKTILSIAIYFENLEFIDFGGGFGVPYKPDDKEFNFKKFGEELKILMRNFNNKTGMNPYVIFEPGRYIVAESCALLVTVTDIKSTPKYFFVGVNSGFNHLIRPMAFGSYHHIINASNVNGYPKEVIIAGYLCESGDVFTRSETGIMPRSISEPKIGDILAILTAGAYGFSMSSNYNMRIRPAEVMVKNEESFLIRRRENIDDLLNTQLFY